MKTVRLTNGDRIQVKATGDGWVADGFQVGNKTGDIYRNNDIVTGEIPQPIKRDERGAQ